MNVAFHLRRRSHGGAAVALLLPTRDVAALLGLCAQLGLDPFGRVHDLAEGYLLRLDDPTARAFPGAVRLRSLAENLFLPVDAELVPALLDDEAEGLTRHQGLVILPGERVLGFDPAAPLAPSALLVSTQRPRRAWQPLPDRPPLAGRIEEIAVSLPDESPEAVLDAGAGAIGTEEPRPDAAGPGATLLGSATLGAGRGLAWLGQTLGLKGLARLGSQWMDRALHQAPRLSEGLIGRQAAALGALLEQFRAGDIERALRHALPLSEPGGPRGAVADTGAQLPTHRTTYALSDLLGGTGRGPVSLWTGGQDIMAELAREYRKAALRAIEAGDFRRAAFIYGKLLKDYRAAAQALLRGGLHHDAAILLLTRLEDRRGAALAFEAAGEFDRAVALYHALGDFIPAGDLLRRIGQEDAALRAYRQAADLLVIVEGERGHLAAGELLLSKLGDGALARSHFELGWAQRPGPNSVSCAIRLLQLNAAAGNLAAMRSLLDQAGAFFAWHRDLAQVDRFYNELAILAGPGTGDVAAAREELRDRALVGLTAELRARARPGTPSAALVATLSRRPEAWSSALIRDAEFAITAATRSRTRSPRPAPPDPAAPPGSSDPSVQWLRACRGVLTAFCGAPESGEVFLGFETGAVLAIRPERSEVKRIAEDDLPVTALAATRDGGTLVTLRSRKPQHGVLNTYERAPDGSYRTMLALPLALWGETDPDVTPILRSTGSDRLGVWYAGELHILEVSSLTWRGMVRPPAGGLAPPLLLLPWAPPAEEAARFAVFAHNGRAWTLFDAEGDVIQETRLNWRPSLPPAHRLRAVPVSWMSETPDHLEVVGLGGYGTLHWARFRRCEGGLEMPATAVATEVEGGYLAATIVRPGLIAAVTRSHVDWLRGGTRPFTALAPTRLAFPAAVACVANRLIGELIVIGGDGLIARVPIPM